MLLSAKDITKQIADLLLFDSINFNIEENDKIALYGLNGCGKTTLLNIISNNTDYQGSIICKKNLKISYLNQNLDFDLNSNIKTIVKNLGKEYKEYQINSLLTKFKLEDQNKELQYFSGGQLKRLALVLALVKECDLLILDEPTNHLDNEMIEYLEKYLMKSNQSLVMVTHDRYFLERVSNKIIEISNQKLYEYPGNYSSFLELKEKREQDQLSAQKKRKSFLNKEIEWVRSSPQARSTKQKERLKRFEELSNIKDINENSKLEIIQTASRLGKKTIEINNISKSYDKLLFSNFSYNFKRYDRIGIIGDNGLGKTTLLNIIANEIKPDSGYIDYGETVKISYFKQHSYQLDQELNVIQTIINKSNDFKNDDQSLSAINLANKFLFDKKLQTTQVSRLSGGQKRRLHLLLCLLEKGNVLILDEPTNDLDIDTLQVLEDFIDDFQGIVITVSHDRYFLDRIADGIFKIEDQKITYLNKLDYDNQKEPEVKEKIVKKKEKRSKLSYLEKKELESMDQKIEIVESKINDKETQLNTVTDYNKLTYIAQELKELEEDLDILNNRYLELLEKSEG